MMLVVVVVVVVVVVRENVGLRADDGFENGATCEGEQEEEDGGHGGDFVLAFKVMMMVMVMVSWVLGVGVLNAGTAGDGGGSTMSRWWIGGEAMGYGEWNWFASRSRLVEVVGSW